MSSSAPAPERPKVCILLDAMETAPAAARDVALSLVWECLFDIAEGKDAARAFRDLALFARLAADNESHLARANFPDRE